VRVGLVAGLNPTDVQWKGFSRAARRIKLIFDGQNSHKMSNFIRVGYLNTQYDKTNPNHKTNPNPNHKP